MNGKIWKIVWEEGKGPVLILLVGIGFPFQHSLLYCCVVYCLPSITPALHNCSCFLLQNTIRPSTPSNLFTNKPFPKTIPKNKRFSNYLLYPFVVFVVTYPMNHLKNKCITLFHNKILYLNELISISGKKYYEISC